MNRKTSLTILTRSALMLAVILASQGLHLPQMITGPLVNAVLIYSTLTLGLTSGVVLSILAVVGSFILGFMKVPLPPLIPLIMLANIVFVLCFKAFIKDGSLIRLITSMITGAFAKFLVFYLGINYIFSWLNIVVPAPVYAAFGAIQLLTAVIGGIVAILVDRAIGGRGRLKAGV